MSTQNQNQTNLINPPKKMSKPMEYIEKIYLTIRNSFKYVFIAFTVLFVFLGFLPTVSGQGEDEQTRTLTYLSDEYHTAVSEMQAAEKAKIEADRLFEEKKKAVCSKYRPLKEFKLSINEPLQSQVDVCQALGF